MQLNQRLLPSHRFSIMMFRLFRGLSNDAEYTVELASTSHFCSRFYMRIGIGISLTHHLKQDIASVQGVKSC